MVITAVSKTAFLSSNLSVPAKSYNIVLLLKISYNIPLMSEVPKSYADLSRNDKSHFLAPVFAAATSNPKLEHTPTWRLRHARFAWMLATEMDEPSKATREYWEEHNLPQPRQINDNMAAYLIRSGRQDFHRIAVSGNRRLRVELVRPKKRAPILRNSHELLKVARISLEHLKRRTDPGIPILAAVNLRRPDAVHFGLYGAIPLRGTVYDAEAGVVRLSDTYDRWITEYREAMRRAGIVAGCPAPHVPIERPDNTRTNLLAQAWEGYVNGVYAGKPRTASKLDNQ
jgi:hypothetical protein